MNNQIVLKYSINDYPIYREGMDTLVNELRNILHIIGYPKLRPFAQFISSQSSIVLKPNWVADKNPNDDFLSGTVTHPSIIFAVAELIAESINGVGEIIIGDAPIQACNFENLLTKIDFFHYLESFEKKFPNIKIIIEDWRLTKFLTIDAKNNRKQQVSTENPSENEFMLYQLGERSFLEEISQDSSKFRVTCYPYSKMLLHHSPGKHEYLLSKTPLSADLLINLPKLKTHLKTGLTGALKNLVGINGSKEFLPHHRRGSPKEGGDCYHDSNIFRRIYDKIYDDYWENLSTSPYLLNKTKEILQDFFYISSIVFGASRIDSGSWPGNDTIWRTVLDINNILYFGDFRPKHIISIVDGIISGEGDGPLKSIPKPIGVIIASRNPLLIDLLISKLIDYDYKKIPLLFQALTHEKSELKINDIEKNMVSIIDRFNHLSCKLLVECEPISDFKVPIGWENEKDKHNKREIL